MRLTELYQIVEMARQREEAMWAVLDWAATQPGEFTIKDLHREWAKAGGGGDGASYQQFSTAINNYIYKYDPTSSVPKYRNPRYKYIRVGKTDKGTVPAPLQYVTKGHRGAGAAHVLRWRTGIPPMRQPAPGTKAPISREGDPVGDALDRLEKKLGRPALKTAMQRWKQLGDLHKISADIMADSQIKGRDKMLALQVAADSLVSKGQATQAQAKAAGDEMADDVGGLDDRTPFSSAADAADNFGDDERTDPDSNPLGAQRSQDPEEPAGTGDDDFPDDLLHGDEGDSEEVGAPPDYDEPPPQEDQGQDDDDMMRGFLVGTAEGGNEGTRIPVTITYDEDDGATVQREGGEPTGPYEGFNLEVANGVLTQDVFDDLEEDGWQLVAPSESEDAPDPQDTDLGDEDDDEGTPEEDDGDDDGDEEPDDRQGRVSAASYLPKADEDGDKAEHAMYRLLDEGGLDEDDPLFDKLRAAKNQLDASSIITRSGLPRNLVRSALIVAQAIFDRDGRDWETGERRGPKRESRLASLYGISESPLEEPVDFDQKSGLARLYQWDR